MTLRRRKYTTNAEPSGLFGCLPYGEQKSLLTDGELRFYRDGLMPAIASRFGVMVKVRLTDVLEVPDHLWRSDAGRKVQQRHVDFVLVRKKSLKIVCVIELDDKSHDKKEQKLKDAYLGDALLAAGVPLIRMPIYRRYDSVKLRKLILGTLKRHPLNAKPEPKKRSVPWWLFKRKSA